MPNKPINPSKWVFVWVSASEHYSLPLGKKFLLFPHPVNFSLKAQLGLKAFFEFLSFPLYGTNQGAHPFVSQ